jgi:hypothetical protein
LFRPWEKVQSGTRLLVRDPHDRLHLLDRLRHHHRGSDVVVPAGIRLRVAVLADGFAAEDALRLERRRELVERRADQRPAPANVAANGRLTAFSSPTRGTRRGFHG